MHARRLKGNKETTPQMGVHSHTDNGCVARCFEPCHHQALLATDGDYWNAVDAKPTTLSVSQATGDECAPHAHARICVLDAFVQMDE
jgi:hypothetical protein